MLQPKIRRTISWTVLLSIVLVFFFLSFAALAQAQDKIISEAEPRLPNLSRIARVWNSLIPATKRWNEALEAADTSIHLSYGTKVLNLNIEERHKRVMFYRQAREAALEQIAALDELIDEEGRE